MALPDDLDTVEITGRWVGLDGQPSAGRVTLTPTADRLVSVATETTIIGVPITIPLDAHGAMRAEVPVTDDPDIAGGPWYYTVTVQASRRSYSFPLVVPTGSEPIDLADYTPPTGVPDVPEPYVLSVNGSTGHVIIPEGPQGPQGERGEQGPQGDQGPPGRDGVDGREVELDADAEAIRWRYVDGTWEPLVPLADLVGPQGDQGPPGEIGPGLVILGELETVDDLPDSAEPGAGYVIVGRLHVWTGDAWVDVGPIQGPPGADGDQGPPGPEGDQGPPGRDGREVELDADAEAIRWRYVDGTWEPLVDLVDITGPPGADGAPGQDGADGRDGTDGAPGDTSWVWSAPNASATPPNGLAHRAYNLSGEARTVTVVHASVASTSATAIVVELAIDGVVVGSVTIPSGANDGSTTLSETVAAGSYMSVVVAQGDAAAEALTVQARVI